MKRKLALLMAFMMATTLFTAQPAFAKSKNNINRTVTTTTNGKVEKSDKVELKIEKDGDTLVDEVFELHLGSGAKWDSSVTTNVNGANVVIKEENILEVKATSDTILMPMIVNFSGASEGAQKVKVVPTKSVLSAGEYVYANIGAQNVKMAVEKKYKISRTGSNEVIIVLEEIAKGSFAEEVDVTLRLPKGFTFESLTPGATVENEKRDLKVALPANSPTGKHYVKVKINPDRTARTGDVDLSVKEGKISPSSLVVAEYVLDGIDVKAEKVLDVIAGKDVEGLYKAKVTLEENVANALLNGRYVEFSLSGAALQEGETFRLKRIAGNADLDIDSTSTKALDKSTSVDNTDDGTDTAAIVTTKDTDGSNFDLHVDSPSTDRNASKFELEIPFVVNSDVVGDVVLNVKGAGVSGDAKNGGVDVVIAKAKAPITVETVKPLPQVKIGLQQQKGSDIIVKEVEKGALQDYVVNGVEYQENGKTKHKDLSYANYSISSSKGTFGIQFDEAKVEVTESNMTLNKYNTKRITVDRNDKMKNAIQIAVDRKSTDKPAVIKVSDVKLTLDRTVPYGDVKLDANFGFASNRHNTDEFTNTTTSFDYLTTVTPVSDDKRVTTVFKIGEKAYTELVGNEKEEKMADVAPFIKDNRTMLPVRYVANAIGAIVNYDPTTRVATFTKNQVVVSINIDKDVMYANGSPVKLDTKPANVEGRIFLPIANIAQAFGLKHGETIIWNQENKTVTILPQDAKADEIEAAKEGKVGEGSTMKEEKKEETKTENFGVHFVDK